MGSDRDRRRTGERSRSRVLAEASTPPALQYERNRSRGLAAASTPGSSPGRTVGVFIALVAIGCATIGVAAACGGGTGVKGDQVVVDSWGGDFQKAQSEIIFSPFQERDKVTVVQLSDGENIYAKVKAQASRSTGEIDLVHGDASWLTRGVRDHLWAAPDYPAIGGDQLYPDARDGHGVGILYWSFNIVYNPAKFPQGAPTTWAQVWEYAKKHPKRVAMFSARPNYVIEAALMAGGTPVGGVYPLTPERIDRGYAALDQIKDNLVWYETGAQGSRLFEDNQVDVGMFYGGDAFKLKVSGKPVTVVWNQGLYTRDYWLIPANAPQPDQVTRLIRFALQPGQQARMAERTGYGPVCPAAVSELGKPVQAQLTSLEPQKSEQLNYDYRWWGDNDDAQLERWTRWLRG